MLKKDIVIKHSNFQHFTAYFDKSSGFFLRKEDEGYPEPFWSNDAPELIDISITNWCDKGCSICYRNSNDNGHHMKLEDYENIMIQAKEIGVFQVALGGGNPNQHPDFCRILELTRKKYGIVPSYTTNGRGLSKDILEYSKKFCGAVAVSYYEPQDEFNEAIELLLNYNIKVNVHFVLTFQSINTAIKLLKNDDVLLNKINSIIFLNYKPVGDYPDNNLLLNRSPYLSNFFHLLEVKKFKCKIGFDSCSVSGIVKYLNVPEYYIESCESGRFSAFISEDLKMYPCSFMINDFNGANLMKKSIQEIWQCDDNFVKIRSLHKNIDASCNSCEFLHLCQGGCPIINNINLCI